MTLCSLFQPHTSKYCQVSTAGPLHDPTPETGGPVFGEKYVDETRCDKQISGGKVLRTGVSCKSLVAGEQEHEYSARPRICHP